MSSRVSCSSEQSDIVIKFRKHSIYNLYAGSECGKFINVHRKVISIGTRKRNGYLSCIVRALGGVKWKRLYVHRFIWGCWNGLIPEGIEIDHYNDIRDDNRLSNLPLVTRSENSKKAAKKGIIHLSKIFIVVRDQ